MQLAKANLGEPYLNNQIKKIHEITDPLNIYTATITFNNRMWLNVI